MTFPRSSGILLHPTSLPGAHGIGELGGEAHRFADFLKDAGQSIWQVLPLGPTGYGDSPYQCFSAFAGNPLLINLDTLVKRGYLSSDDLAQQPKLPRENVDFGTLIRWKLPLLAKAAANFRRSADGTEKAAFDAFCQRHASWLDEFALFMALKETHNYVMWTLWEPALALREPAALERARTGLRDKIETNKFVQFEFDREWSDLKAHCARNGIRVVGVGPGTIDTEMVRGDFVSDATDQAILARTPLGRYGTAAEIAAVVAFLASDDASYITGETIYPDGGRRVLNYVMPSK